MDLHSLLCYYGCVAVRQVNRLCARILNKKNIHTVNCVGSKALDNVVIVLTFTPIILAIYLHVLSRAIVNKDLT
jgi:hypothetical protein